MRGGSSFVSMDSHQSHVSIRLHNIFLRSRYLSVLASVCITNLSGDMFVFFVMAFLTALSLSQTSHAASLPSVSLESQVSQIYFFFQAISELDQYFRPDATFLANGVRPPDNSLHILHICNRETFKHVTQYDVPHDLEQRHSNLLVCKKAL